MTTWVLGSERKRRIIPTGYLEFVLSANAGLAAAASFADGGVVVIGCQLGQKLPIGPPRPCITQRLIRPNASTIIPGSDA